MKQLERKNQILLELNQGTSQPWRKKFRSQSQRKFIYQRNMQKANKFNPLKGLMYCQQVTSELKPYNQDHDHLNNPIEITK